MSVKRQIQKLPKSMQQVYVVADKCVKKLIEKGESPKEAENMVLEILKESEEELKNGSYKLVIASLEMIFLNVNIETASKKIIQQLM